MSNIVVFTKKDKYIDSNSINDVVKYVMDRSYNEKEGTLLSNAYGVNQLSTDYMIKSMENVNKRNNQTEGKQIYHFVVSIYKYSATYLYRKGIAKLIQNTVGLYFYKLGYQIISGIHDDDGYIHIHCVVNNTNFITGNKLHNIQYIFNNLLGILRKEYKDLKWEGVYYNDI